MSNERRESAPEAGPCPPDADADPNLDLAPNLDLDLDLDLPHRGGESGVVA